MSPPSATNLYLKSSDLVAARLVFRACTTVEGGLPNNTRVSAKLCPSFCFEFVVGSSRHVWSLLLGFVFCWTRSIDHRTRQIVRHCLRRNHVSGPLTLKELFGIVKHTVFTLRTAFSKPHKLFGSPLPGVPPFSGWPSGGSESDHGCTTCLLRGFLSCSTHFNKFENQSVRKICSYIVSGIRGGGEQKLTPQGTDLPDSPE